MRQLQGASLQIHVFLLILAHSVKFLAVVALKSHRERIISADYRLVIAGNQFEASALIADGTVITSVIFPEDKFAISVKRKNADLIHIRSYAAVCDARRSAVDCNLNRIRTILLLLGKRPVIAGKCGIFGAAYTK